MALKRHKYRKAVIKLGGEERSDTNDLKLPSRGIAPAFPSYISVSGHSIRNKY